MKIQKKESFTLSATGIDSRTKRTLFANYFNPTNKSDVHALFQKIKIEREKDCCGS